MLVHRPWARDTYVRAEECQPLAGTSQFCRVSLVSERFHGVVSHHSKTDSVRTPPNPGVLPRIEAPESLAQ